MTDTPDLDCSYCNEAVEPLSASPLKWPLYFPDPDQYGTGKGRNHHVGCLAEKLKADANEINRLRTGGQKRWTDRFDFIAIQMRGDTGDWLDAIESYGVRPGYENGAHRAWLGRDEPNWSNATVACFSNKQLAQEWCDKTNEILYEGSK